MNLDRIKFLEMFICTLCKMQTIGFQKLAIAFETPAKYGRQAKNTYKYGLEIIAMALLNPLEINKIDIFIFLAYT